MFRCNLGHLLVAYTTPVLISTGILIGRRYSELRVAIYANIHTAHHCKHRICYPNDCFFGLAALAHVHVKRQIFHRLDIATSLPMHAIFALQKLLNSAITAKQRGAFSGRGQGRWTYGTVS
jgi:hypothetical protein